MIWVGIWGMGKFADFCLGPDQLLTECDNTICDTMAPGTEVSAQNMGREGCTGAGECKNLQWEAGCNICTLSFWTHKLREKRSCRSRKWLHCAKLCSTDFLLMVPDSIMSLLFPREGVMRGEGCQYMTVLFTDMYCSKSHSKSGFNLFRVGLVISHGNRGLLSWGYQWWHVKP